MKKLIMLLSVMIILLCNAVCVLAENYSFRIFSYDQNGKEYGYALMGKVSDFELKNESDEELVFNDDRDKDIEIDEKILAEAKDNECLIMLDLKTNNDENPYPELKNEINIRIETQQTSGGVAAQYIGKDYRLIYIDDANSETEDLSSDIVSSGSQMISFAADKLGMYVIYFNPNVYGAVFYAGEPIPTEEGNIMPEIYYQINDLKKNDILKFPPIPEKEGYVFTGWKTWSGSGIYFTGPQPIEAISSGDYYASWCSEDEYEPIEIEILSDEAITKGKEEGQKITLKTNYGVFVSGEEFPGDWRTAYDEQTDEESKAAVLSDWKSKWNIVGSDDIMIESATRIDDKTVEFILSGNSSDIYNNSQIFVEFDSSLLMPEPYEENGEIVDWDDTKIKMDEDGVRAKMYGSDNTLTLTRQSRPGGSGGLGVARYTVSFDTGSGEAVGKQTVTANSKATEPEAPEKEGYVFVGWFSDKELTEEYDFSSKVTKNITLYAKWDEVDLTKNQIILTVGKKEATVFGETKINDVAPLIKDDRAYLPARFVAESLGAEVYWDDTTKTVTIIGENVKIAFSVGEDYALVNGEQVKLEMPAFIENDRTYTPIRFIAENLGATVDWTEGEQMITITK